MPPVSSKRSADPTPAERPAFWSLKPWWCQPWSILLSGCAVVAGSWWWPHRLWISLPLAVGVAAWWTLFLALVPAAYRNGTLSEIE